MDIQIASFRRHRRTAPVVVGGNSSRVLRTASSEAARWVRMGRQVRTLGKLGIMRLKHAISSSHTYLVL